MWTKLSCGFMVTFVITDDGTKRFQTVLFKPERDKLFVLSVSL